MLQKPTLKCQNRLNKAIDCFTCTIQTIRPLNIPYSGQYFKDRKQNFNYK